jgi:hypothetical protein
VYVFSFDGKSWGQRQKILTADGRAGEGFGRAIALEGDRAVIGADGAVRVFERSGKLFGQMQKISPPRGANALTFGRTVALSGSTLIVGSSTATVGKNAAQGAVYVYELTGFDFALKQTLVAADGRALDHFGSAIAIDHDTVAVGTDSARTPSAGVGAAYVFRRSGGAFRQRAKLAPADGSERDAFGRVVAVLGELVVVGAPLHEHGGFNADHGAVYTFRDAGSRFTQTQEIYPRDAQNNDHFGSAVALAPGLALVGSPNDDVPFVANGSAYVEAAEPAKPPASSQATPLAAREPMHE